MVETKSLRRGRSRMLFVALLCVWTASPALAITITINYEGVFEGIIGKLTVFSINGGIVGSFTPSNDRTLAQLEADLGQNHLNFFQKAFDPDMPPFVDPRKGGGITWADNRPWFWNEEPCPATANCNPAFDLTPNIIEGKSLRFADQPGGFSVEFSFATFLISDYGDKTYKVFQPGFTWTVQFDAGGVPSITSLAGDAKFKDDYNSEIGEFGWTLVGTLPTPPEVADVSEPRGVLMVSFGLTLIVTLIVRRTVIRLFV